MLESVKSPIQTVVVALITIVMIFFALVWMQNGNTMLVSVEMQKKTKIVPKLYFAKQGEDFSKQHSVEGREKKKHLYALSVEVQEKKKHLYALSLPAFESMQRVLLKPTQKKGDVIIHNITVIQTNWFSKTMYTLPLNNLSPFHQMEDFKQDKNNISFQATGVDTMLDVKFFPEAVSTSRDKHIGLLLIAILFYSIIYSLYRLYKIEELNTFFTSKLILYSLFFALAMFKVEYYKDNIHFEYPPDELAHLSYVDHVHKHNEFLPKFETMHMLNNPKAGNYLSHPPLYYKILDLAYDENYSIYQNVDNFRTMSMIIFLASFLLLLYFGFSAKMGILAHFVYLSVISSVPMFAYLGGSINNDTLAIFGGLVFIAGFKRLLEKEYTTLTYFILGLGIFIAYFSKLTVAVLIFFVFVFYLFYLLKIKEIPKITKVQFGMLLLFLVPIFYYQAYIIFTYHSLVPTFNKTHPEEYLKSAFFVPETFRHYLTHYEWFERLRHYIEGGWFGIHSHHSFTKETVWQYMGLLILHIFALFALFFRCKTENRSFCLVGKIALLSLLSVLVVQYFQSYGVHLSKGYIGGLQPRYLLPFMFAFAIMASIFVERFNKLFIVTILTIVICIHAIYSDFFYFLQYYQ